MTEHEWQASQDPEAMLDFVIRVMEPTNRQLTLCFAAFTRFVLANNSVWTNNSDDSCDKLERFADGDETGMFDGIDWVRSLVRGQGILRPWTDFFHYRPAFLREFFGPVPFREARVIRGLGAAKALADAAYIERKLPEGTLDPSRLAVLADALEEAGVSDSELLAHLRSEGPHYRGCWALDGVLGKS